MKITSSGIKEGRIDLVYGKFGEDFVGDMPSRSLPFSIHEAPAGTKSFALILDDKDARPVAGFVWIHWLAANIKTTDVPAGVSGNRPGFTEGLNSWGVSQYGGMAPPNAPHRYDLRVFALDVELPLTNGFSEEALIQAMKGHILAEASLHGMYPN